jgi:exosortase/archaeosortase family protein
MIPLPGFLVDAITGPLKQWISTIVVELLYRAGYPIANTGVMLTVGKYELLVADACSGLHSMYSLTALGTLFMYIMARARVLHNALMLVSILPIAFAANIVRVVVLVLITYHLGDEAGQGFLHGFAGMVLMLVALAGFFALDALLARLLRRRRSAPGGRAVISAPSRRRRSPLSLRRVSAFTAAIMSAANRCWMTNARAESSSIEETRNSSPSGIWPVKAARISAIRLSQTSRMTCRRSSASRSPVRLRDLRFVVRRRTSIGPKSVANWPSDLLPDLEALRRVADLGPVRLQAAALVVAVGHRQHDPVPVLVDVGAGEDLAVDRVQQGRRSSD